MLKKFFIIVSVISIPMIGMNQNCTALQEKDREKLTKTLASIAEMGRPKTSTTETTYRQPIEIKPKIQPSLFDIDEEIFEFDMDKEQERYDVWDDTDRLRFRMNYTKFEEDLDNKSHW